MSWYTHYLQVYNRPWNKAPKEIVEKVQKQLVKQQSDQPLVTISVIAYNEEEHLLACLWSLSEQVCNYPVEIVGVNNNSSDKTEEIFQALGIPYHNELRQSCGYARQCGLNHAKGKYHINIDADTIYPPHYIEIMTEVLMRPGVIAASSFWSYIPDKSHSKISLILYETLRDIYLLIQSWRRPELSVRGLVFAYRIEEARKEGIRVELKRGEDGSLALALKKYGKIAFVRSRKARAITGYGTISSDGTLFNSFKVRFIKGVKNLPHLFQKKEVYKDEESNLIK